MQRTKEAMGNSQDVKGAKPPLQTDLQTLVAGLNQDLAGEYQAILMYIHYSATITGPFRRELRALFQAEIADEQMHALFLADKITALGGEPTTDAPKVPDAGEPREMLRKTLAAEERAIRGYRERIRQAETFGDIALKVNQLADETRHKEQIERILVGWDDLEDKRKIDARWQDDGGQG